MQADMVIYYVLIVVLMHACMHADVNALAMIIDKMKPTMSCC